MHFLVNVWRATESPILKHAYLLGIVQRTFPPCSCESALSRLSALLVVRCQFQYPTKTKHLSSALMMVGVVLLSIRAQHGSIFLKSKINFNHLIISNNTGQCINPGNERRKSQGLCQGCVYSILQVHTTLLQNSTLGTMQYSDNCCISPPSSIFQSSSYDCEDRQI